MSAVDIELMQIIRNLTTSFYTKGPFTTSAALLDFGHCIKLLCWYKGDRPIYIISNSTQFDRFLTKQSGMLPRMSQFLDFRKMDNKSCFTCKKSHSWQIPKDQRCICKIKGHPPYIPGQK